MQSWLRGRWHAECFVQLTEETGAADILAMLVRRPWHTKARPCAQCCMLDPWLKCPVRLGFET